MLNIYRCLDSELIILLLDMFIALLYLFSAPGHRIHLIVPGCSMRNIPVSFKSIGERCVVIFKFKLFK